MKHFKLISILCVALGVSAAQAETKVSGEFFGNFQLALDNGSPNTTDDRINPMGFDVTRARVGVSHAFNENWSVNFKIDADDTNNMYRAFLTGKNWLADGHTMHFGLQQNAYSRMWDTMNLVWIHGDVTSEYLGEIATAYGLNGNTSANLSNYAGLNYNIALNDMWQVEFSVNNGPTEEVSNGGGTGNSHDVTGYGLTAMGKFNDNFGLLLAYDTYADGKSGADDSAANNIVDGFTTTRANLFYTSDMIDAGLEYAMFTHSESTSGTDDLEDSSVMALNVNWKYADGKSVYAYYLMATDWDTSTAADDVNVDGNLEAAYTVGHIWTLEKGISTGAFYEAKTRDSATGTDGDESTLMWKWAASF